MQIQSEQEQNKGWGFPGRRVAVTLAAVWIIT